MTVEREIYHQPTQPEALAMDFERAENRHPLDQGLRWVLSILIYWASIRGLWLLFKSHWSDIVTAEPNVISFFCLTVAPMLVWGSWSHFLFLAESRVREWMVARAFPETATEA